MAKASEWKARGEQRARAEAVSLGLPSGMTILARRPDPVQLAVWGRLPLQLAAASVRQKVEPELTVEDGIELMTFHRDLLTYCCVEPHISLTPSGEGEIHPKDIPEEDWKYILRWAMRFEEARQLEPFRGQRAGSGVGGDGEVMGSPAIDVVGVDGSASSLEF